MRDVAVVDTTARGDILGALKSWWKSWPDAGAHVAHGGFAAANRGPDSLFANSVRVLVVDDEPVNLMMVSAQMETRGVSCLLVADGAEAVALACELHFDLILMDLQLPVLDGLQATAAIRAFEARHRHAAVPVVAYSSRSLCADELATSGLSGQLAKPFARDDLDDCLRQWCPGLTATGRAGVGPGKVRSAILR